MVGRAGSTTGIVHADMTLNRSKVKVKVTGLLNFRQLAKPCMLVAMTAASLRGFLVLCYMLWFCVFPAVCVAVYLCVFLSQADVHYIIIFCMRHSS